MMDNNSNFEMYPFVSKEEFQKYKRLYEEQKEVNDELHNKLDLFNFALNGEKINDKKFSEIMKQNIINEIKIKQQEKQAKDLNIDIEKLKQNIKKNENEKKTEEDRIKFYVQKWINIEESTQQKVKLLEETEYKLNKAQKELEKVQNLKIDVLKEIKEYPPYDHNKEYKKINKILLQIEKKINAKFFRDKKREKAKHLLFDVKKKISFMDKSQKDFYQEKIERLENDLI